MGGIGRPLLPGRAADEIDFGRAEVGLIRIGMV